MPMSRTKQTHLVCPACGASQTFRMWESLNVQIDPGEKEKLLSGELCTLTCNKCNQESLIEHDLLYHDLERKLMVQMRYEDADGHFAPAHLPALLAALPGYRYRVVPDLRHLIEKILIFDDGLDDRIVEVLKLRNWRQILDLAPDSEPLSGEIFYQELASGDDGARQLILAILTEDDVYPVSVPEAGYITTIALVLNSLKREEKSGWLAVDQTYGARVAHSTHATRPQDHQWASGATPEGGIRWVDEGGEVKQGRVPPGWLDNVIERGQGKIVYRVLIKDPIYDLVQVDFWELTEDQVSKFVDADNTAYCAIAYKRGEQKLLLVDKLIWQGLPGWKD